MKMSAVISQRHIWNVEWIGKSCSSENETLICHHKTNQRKILRNLMARDELKNLGFANAQSKEPEKSAAVKVKTEAQ